MANPLRGEVDIILSGKSYTLRPTFQALCELENKASSSIYKIARRFEEGSFTLTDITCIVWSGIRGTLGSLAPNYDEIGQQIVNQGIASIISPCCEYLAGALGINSDTENDIQENA